MADFPRLQTDRLILETFTERRLTERYVSWLNDPEIVRYSVQRYRRHDRESCRAYMAGFAGTPHFFAAIIAKEPSLGHIGNINAYIDEHDGVADLGILIGERAAWGNGYGAEAWQAMCNYLLLRQGIRKVAAGTLVTNAAMLAIMRKTGMKEDGCRRRHAIHEGREVDVVHAALFREDMAN